MCFFYLSDLFFRNGLPFLQNVDNDSIFLVLKFIFSLQVFFSYSFELDKSQLNFRPYNEYIEFALVSFGTDKHIFTDYASNNLYSDDNVLSEIRQEQTEYDNLPKQYIVAKTILFLILLLGALLVILYTFQI